jgi:hypothetical protein
VRLRESPSIPPHRRGTERRSEAPSGGIRGPHDGWGEGISLRLAPLAPPPSAPRMRPQIIRNWWVIRRSRHISRGRPLRSERWAGVPLACHIAEQQVAPSPWPMRLARMGPAVIKVPLATVS